MTGNRIPHRHSMGVAAKPRKHFRQPVILKVLCCFYDRGQNAACFRFHFKVLTPNSEPGIESTTRLVPPVHASGKSYVSESRQKNSRRNQPTAVCRSPELDGVALGAIVKIAMRAMISRYRLPQIVAPVWVHRFICLL
jgi:hypothetical protein